MGRPHEAAGAALASQRDLAVDVLNRRSVSDDAQRDADNRHAIRRTLGYPNTFSVRADPVRFSIRVGSPVVVQVVNPPKPPWYRRWWAKFIATEAATEGVKWVAGRIIDAAREMFRWRHAPSPTR